MPARRVAWRPVLWGALVTALLFHLGRWLIALYLARTAQPSAFGAAASFVAMLLWLYYTAQIFLLGAEFTACLGGLRDAQDDALHARAGTHPGSGRGTGPATGKLSPSKYHTA